MSGLLLRDVEVEGARVDVHLGPDAIEAVAPRLPAARPGTAEVDGHGGALLPGLHDHHVHLLATAAARASTDLARLGVTDRAGFEAALRAADATAAPGAWLRVVGHHESIGGDLDGAALDRLLPHRPVRVQDRSGARWTLNGRALAEARVAEGDHPGIERGADGRPTGRLHRADDWLRGRLPADAAPDLAALGRRLAALGITGVTDTTPSADGSAFALLASAGLPQRTTVTGGPELAAGPCPPGLALGPVKLVLDDATGAALDDLVRDVAAAHAARRPVAFHAVTRASAVLALAALEVAPRRRGDRIEHGAVLPLALFDALRELGVVVVTQPGFVRERGDAYLVDVDPEDLGDLYRCRSLLDAGIPVAGSSDAPYTDGDPWTAARAAVERRSLGGRTVGPDERVAPEVALRLFLGAADDPGGPPRRVAVGQPADVVLLDRPLAEQLRDLTAEAVVATLVRGRVVHHR